MPIQGLPTFTMPGEELAKAPTEIQNIINDILTNRIKQSTEQRQQQLFPYTIQHHQDVHTKTLQDMAIAKAAEARTAQQFPYLLQQYQDLHKKRATDQEQANLWNRVYNEAYKQALQGGVQAPQAQVAQAQMAQSPQAQPEMAQVQPPSFTPNVSRETQAYDQLQNMMQQRQFSGVTPIPQQAQMAQPVLAQAQVSQAQPKTAESEQVIRQGNPALAVLDKLAGIGPNAPQLKYHFGKDGTIITEYPSGKLALSKYNQAVNEMPDLTKSTITTNQKIVQSVDNTIPRLNELLESKIPGQFVGKYLSPSEQANYEASIAEVTDTLVSALNLPKTNESLQLAKTMVIERPFENRKDYKTRINNLIENLNERKKRAISALKEKSVVSAPKVKKLKIIDGKLVEA